MYLALLSPSSMSSLKTSFLLFFGFEKNQEGGNRIIKINGDTDGRVKTI